MKLKPLFYALLWTTLTARQGLASSPLNEAEFLKELVGISSGTSDVAGVNQVQEKIAEKLRSLGFSVELKDNPSPEEKSGRQLVATLKGADPRYISLIGHADTVFEKLNPFTVSPDAKIAKGSGVSDNKGGVVVGLSALGTFLGKISSPPHFSMRVIVSPSEETGSNGFDDALKRYASNSVIVLGLEPARENGAIVISRKGARWYTIHVTGKEAHAGVDHESGVNACHELAIKLDKLQGLTDYKKGNTVSIGRIEGVRTNSILFVVMPMPKWMSASPIWITRKCFLLRSIKSSTPLMFIPSRPRNPPRRRLINRRIRRPFISLKKRNLFWKNTSLWSKKSKERPPTGNRPEVQATSITWTAKTSPSWMA